MPGPPALAIVFALTLGLAIAVALDIAHLAAVALGAVPKLRVPLTMSGLECFAPSLSTGSAGYGDWPGENGNPSVNWGGGWQPWRARGHEIAFGRKPEPQ